MTSELKDKKILVTGGAGFIGSHLLSFMVQKYPNAHFVNFDKLTYAGNLANLQSIESSPNYTFVKGDICDFEQLEQTFQKHNITDVIHLAAESHVDRSISNPMSFVHTNVIGTVNLLNAFRASCTIGESSRFYHVSTDEVFGSLGDTGLFTENTPYDPRSPYSASKASSDHFVRAYYHTYDLPIVMSNCSNNYGPYQFPEKLIPLMINNIFQQKELPVYGDGKNIRDWLYVRDHVKAIDLVFSKGRTGECYNIGGNNELQNIELVNMLCDIVDAKMDQKIGTSRKLIRFVKDRAGHDRRYAIDASKIEKELSWKPETTVNQGLESTVIWYLNNKSWMENVTSGDYQDYYKEHYG